MLPAIRTGSEDCEVRRSKQREESHPQKEDLSSFEAVMLPHLDAAHNLAKWLLRNEEDA